MNNKKIVLFIVIFLLVSFSILTYLIIRLNGTTKSQSNETKTLKKTATLNELKSIADRQQERSGAGLYINPNIRATLVYQDVEYEVYSFNNNMNVIDLNFDGISDVVIKSLINGTDYHDWHELAEKNVYTFYIDRADGAEEYWNIVSKEIAGNQIEKFDRDFVLSGSGIQACNYAESMGMLFNFYGYKGEDLRVVLNGRDETILALITVEEKNDTKNYINYELYKLVPSGHVLGSDYIFSYINTIRIGYDSCDLKSVINDGVVNATKQAGL